MLAAEKIHVLPTARPLTDQFRLAALHRYNILDTPASEEFNFLTELAARLCNVPYSFISLVDAERVWIKAHTGMELSALPRTDCYCSLAILGDSATEITDLRADYRTAHMPLTTNAPPRNTISGQNAAISASVSGTCRSNARTACRIASGASGR